MLFNEPNLLRNKVFHENIYKIIDAKPESYNFTSCNFVITIYLKLMPIINSFLTWIIKKRIHQIELFVKYPHEVQSEVFKKLLLQAKNTEWGRYYDYSSIADSKTFRNRVPLFNYEKLKPFIDRLRKGEQNILWPSEIKWFAKSSGTTAGKSKFIPVSQEAIEDCHFKGGKDLLAIYCNNNTETMIFDGKGLGLGGSHQIAEVDNQSYYGDLSAIIIQNLPFWADFIRTPNLSIALMDEWERKIEQMAIATSKDNVTNIFGVPSWTLLLLKRVLEITGKSNLQEVWPNLELFAHGGVNFSPYREQFKKISPPGMRFLETYNASEGFFGIQDLNESNEMLLMLDYGIYYEFLPLENINDESPLTLGLHEVELKTNYALIISTNAGLWRYMIGDTIMFTSLEPYRFRITGRTKNFINAVGEELIIDNAEQAIAIACEKTGVIINEYTAAPIYLDDNQIAAHEWLIEFEQEPESCEFFAETLDNALKSLNSDYEAKRYKDLILRRPLIHSMPKNSFYNWLKTKGKLGGQHKVPRLFNNRQYVDELLEQKAKLSE